MLMAVFERTRELGMLKAIGLSGWRILWLVLVETMGPRAADPGSSASLPEATRELSRKD